MRRKRRGGKGEGEGEGRGEMEGGKGGEEGEWENCAPYLQILATPLVPSPFAWLLFRSSVIRQICAPYVK